MKFATLPAALLLALSLSGAGLADSPAVQRELGADGVPVISIKGSATQTPTVSAPAPPTTKRKAFKVYDLQGDPEPAAVCETKVVVISSPPPIAPAVGNYGYGYGYPHGYNYYNAPYYGPGTCGPRYHRGYRGSYYSNYTNPPVNYRPLTPLYNSGYRCRR